MASATSATRVILPNALTKSLHANSRCSLPLTRFQPLVLESSVVTSASESFFAGMSHSSRIGWCSLQPLCGAIAAPATTPAAAERAADCVIAAWSGSSLIARGNSTIVGVSPETKIRGVCQCRGYRKSVARKETENEVKKKIRAIQYVVGPIGASIARLMREKQAIEIIGAIDTDPAKVGRDLGEVVGAQDAPWGVTVSADAREVLEQNADVVTHSTSSSLAEVMDQLLMCLEAESSIVSTCEELSYPFRTHPELAAKLDSAAKESGVALIGTGVNPGFVMDKLVVTLAAVSQRIDHAKALRIVDASKRRLPLQKKIGAGLSGEEFRGQVAAGIIKHVGLPESVAMIADSLNLPVDQVTETIEPVVARERVQTEFLTVEAGQAAGVHQIARGLGGGKELVYLELQMYVGAKDPADTIELQV